MSLNRRQGDLEDAELELMEQRETAQGVLDGVQRRIAEAREKRAAVEQRRDESLAEIAKDEDFKRGARGPLAADLPAELVSLYDRIRTDVQLIAERYRIREIAFDRWNATQLATQLQGDGFAMVGFGQGFASMSGPAKELERRIVGRELVHDGNPVLRWMVANVTVSQDPAGNIKPDKAKSTERIDGVVAACMAIGRWQAAEVAPPNIYESRGLAFV